MTPTPTLTQPKPDKIITTLPDHIKYWEQRYQTNSTGWLVNNVHPFLLQNINTVFKSKSATGTKKIFVPLCGTTYDLTFLLSQGFEVFGVEGVESCFDVLNKRDGLGLKFNEKDSTYETEDGRLKIYWGDLYTCPIEKWGPFDFIWDRASIVAIEPQYKGDYIKLMQKSVGYNPEQKDVENDFQYIVELVTYDTAKFGGPPRVITEEDLRSFYPDFNVEIIQKIQQLAGDSVFQCIPKEIEVEITTYKIAPPKN